jgi:hypothetical protein
MRLDDEAAFVAPSAQVPDALARQLLGRARRQAGSQRRPSASPRRRR